MPDAYRQASAWRAAFQDRRIAIRNQPLQPGPIVNRDRDLRTHAPNLHDLPFSEPDLLIAALATLADIIVVSRDVSEFIAAGVPVFDPWHWTIYAGGRADQIADADMADAMAKAAELIAN